MVRPVPDVDDPRFAGFWERTRRGVLSLQRCYDCETPRWPPRPICLECYSFEASWDPVEPIGSLYSWTVVCHQTVQGIEVPYTVGLIELDDPPGVRYLGRVVDVDPERLVVGDSMEAVFEAVDDEVTLVYWRRVEPRAGFGS